MSVKIIKNRWPQITETTSDSERSEGVRGFKIENAHTSWKVKGMKTSNIIIFKIDGYSGYIFSLKNGIVSGKKSQVDRVSDSGILACHEGRFNLISDKGERRTLRLSSLAEYLPKAFV